MVVLKMFVTILPVILGGIANMLFCKSAFYKSHRKPLDNGFCLKDGKRLFGDNKTITGFLSMIVFCSLFQVLIGLTGLPDDMYTRYENTVIFNIYAGALLGFMYMLFELPNSFLKRRLGIEAGKTVKSDIRAVFLIIDRIDSVTGIALVICILSGKPHLFLPYILLGGLTHLFVNLTLLKLKVRRNL